MSSRNPPTGPGFDRYKVATAVCWAIYWVGLLAAGIWLRQQLAADPAAVRRALPGLVVLGYLATSYATFLSFRLASAATLAATFITCLAVLKVAAGLFRPEDPKQWDEVDGLVFYLEAVFIIVPMAVLAIFFGTRTALSEGFQYSYLVQSTKGATGTSTTHLVLETGRWAWVMNLLAVLLAWYWLQVVPAGDDIRFWHLVTGR